MPWVNNKKSSTAECNEKKLMSDRVKTGYSERLIKYRKLDT